MARDSISNEHHLSARHASLFLVAPVLACHLAACTPEDRSSSLVVVVAPLLATEEATLVASDGAVNDQFGSSVALSADGSRAIVGASRDDTAAGANTGSVRVFLRTGTSWAEEATLVASDGAANDFLGGSVALSSDGSRAIVGASSDDTPAGREAGSARVFVRNGTTWAEEATLVASDGAAEAFFGVSVALSADGSRAIIGAFFDQSEIGSTYVFVRNGTTWAEEASLVPSERAAGDRFGTSVALSSDGSRATVGASFDDGGAGSAYVFVRTGTSWAEEAKLVALDRAAGDWFGTSVALSSDGSRTIVGAYLDDTAAGTQAGSARVFVRNGIAWAEEAMLVASDGAEKDGFGVSVALSAAGDRAIIGVLADDTTGGFDTGSARVFMRSGTNWAEEATLVASNGAEDDRFNPVALSADGRLAIVGAQIDDTAAGIDTGSARVFTLSQDDPLANGAPCSTGSTCLSTRCVDGVCCESDCGDGVTNDCQACSTAAGGTTNGTCTARAAPAPCADDGNVCTVDRCDGTNIDCQHPAGNEDITCYDAPANALCEADQVCTGTSPTCPLPALPPDECTAASNDPSACDGAPACLELFGGTDEEGGIEITFLDPYEGEVRVEAAGEDCPPSTGFEIVDMGLGENAHGSGMFIDLKANPPITNLQMKICIRYPQGNMSDDDERRLRIQHGTSEGCPAPGDWTELIEAEPPDQPEIDKNIICAYTRSLSPFALALPVDTAGPVFENVPGTIVAYATSTAGATVSYPLPTAIDSIDGPVPVGCAPASGATFAPGKTMVTCQASDTSGHMSTATFVVWVQYQAPADGSFFLKPPRPNGSSIFRIGKPVAIKFQLAGASKDITNLQARLIVTKVSGAIQGTIDDDCDEDEDDTDYLFKFRKGKGLYAYRWKTRGETQGTYRLRADLGDSVAHEISVSLRNPR